MPTKNQMRWSVAPQWSDVRLICARGWESDLGYYHEDSYDLCQFDRIEGPLGPKNYYKRWAERVSVGDVLMFEPGTPHRAEGGIPADFKVLMLPVARVAQALQELSGKARDLRFDRPASRSLLPWTAAIHELAAREAPGIELEEAFQALLIQLVSAPSRHPVQLDAVDDGLAVAARAYIDDHLASDWTERLELQALVDEVGARGKSQLIRDFGKVYGLSPYEYFKVRRLARARRLLEQSRHVKVAHVAWDVGYTTHSLARLFRELHGTTPRLYRDALSR